MLFHVHRPRPPLDRLVEFVVYFEGHAPGHLRDKLLPDGGIELIVDLTATPKRLYRDADDTTRYREFRGSWISGMRRRYIVIDATGDSMAVIRFRPGGAFPVLGFPVAALTDAVEPLCDVLGPTADTLRERILAARGVDARMAAVEAWLVERVRGREAEHPVVRHLAGRLFAPGGVRIADLVAEIGYSQRRVLDLFRRHVGVAPKSYARVRRFQQVLGYLVHGAGPAAITGALGPPVPATTEPDWADLAVAHGYADQSHLIRDFREFAGLTPVGYLDAYRGLENYLPLE